MNNFDNTKHAHFISDFLNHLGFSKPEIKLYVSLVEHGPMTLLKASEVSGIERTRLYRMIDTLAERKLIELIPQYKRRMIKAVDIQTIQLLVRERELENQYLQNGLTSFAQSMQSLTKRIPGNNVIYYRGVEGIRQMTWNILRTEGLYRTYSYCFWNDILDSKFIKELNDEMLRKHFQVHDLYSDQYIEYKKQWLAQGKGKPEGNWDFWDSRYISEKIVTINQNIDVYNNVVSYYYWQGEETFGVEIYNERVANLQKQMHDVLWKMAKKIPDIDWSSKW